MALDANNSISVMKCWSLWRKMICCDGKKEKDGSELSRTRTRSNSWCHVDAEADFFRCHMTMATISRFLQLKCDNKAGKLSIVLLVLCLCA